MKSETVIPKGWKRASKKELQKIRLDPTPLLSKGFVLYNDANGTRVLDGSCLKDDGEIYLGVFHNTYPMNLVYEPVSRKLIVVVPIKKRKPAKKKKGVKKKSCKKK